MMTCYSERTIRLPRTYWCYEPVLKAIPVAALPALQAGKVTFGCLNNPCKVTIPTLETWSALCRALPRARLLLFAHEGSHRERVRGFMAERGVSADRLEFVGRMPLAVYFESYARIDVSLDPFPYGGGTTTCDALWMGVPVVSLAGHTAVGRGGVSILSNVGLADLVATTPEHYVRIALELANDLGRLEALRNGLRERMRGSPLMDAVSFTRAVEDAYREMWRLWCGRPEAGHDLPLSS